MPLLLKIVYFGQFWAFSGQIYCFSCTLRLFYQTVGNVVNAGMLSNDGKRPVKMYINTRKGLWKTKKVDDKNRVIGNFDGQEYDIAYFLMHELGHVLGLSHLHKPQSIMYESPTSFNYWKFKLAYFENVKTNFFYQDLKAWEFLFPKRVDEHTKKSRLNFKVDKETKFTGVYEFQKFYKQRVYEFTKENAEYLTNYHQFRKVKEENYTGSFSFSAEKFIFKNHNEIYRDMTELEKLKRRLNAELDSSFKRVPFMFKDTDDEDIKLEKYKRVPFTKAEFYDDGRAHLVMDTRLLRLSDADKPGVRTPYVPHVNKHMTGHDDCRKGFWNKLKKPACYGYFYVIYTYDLRLSDDRKVIQEYTYNVCIPDYSAFETIKIVEKEEKNSLEILFNVFCKSIKKAKNTNVSPFTTVTSI